MLSPNKIRSLLKFRNVVLQSLARTAGVSGPVVHRAVSGQARCKRAEEAVAAAIGKTRLEVFGPNKREKGGDS